MFRIETEGLVAIQLDGWNLQVIDEFEGKVYTISLTPKEAGALLNELYDGGDKYRLREADLCGSTPETRCEGCNCG